MYYSEKSLFTFYKLNKTDNTTTVTGEEGQTYPSKAPDAPNLILCMYFY